MKGFESSLEPKVEAEGLEVPIKKIEQSSHRDCDWDLLLSNPERYRFYEQFQRIYYFWHKREADKIEAVEHIKVVQTLERT